MTRLKRYLKNSASLGLLLSLLFSFSNCTLKEPPYKRSEVEERIIGAFQKDFGLEVVTRVAGDSLYIYIPVEGEFLTTIQAPPLPKTDIKFLYADCALKNNTFTISYAAETLPELRLAAQNISQNVTDDIQEIWGKLYQLFHTALTDSPDHFSFFVVYIADIEEGIEMKTTIQETDLKKFFGRAIPPAEFGQRTLRNMRGGKDIIGDKTGKHVDFKNIELKDFICDVITQRLTYSRLRSEKINSIQEEILKIFYITVSGYDFVSYEEVELLDVLKDEEDFFFRHKIEQVFKPLVRRPPQTPRPAKKREEDLNDF